MKVIIDIPQKTFDEIQKHNIITAGETFAQKLIRYIKNGVPLEKIRAEIEQNAYPIVHGVNNHELGMTLYGINQVFDKYKAEVEP